MSGAAPRSCRQRAAVGRSSTPNAAPPTHTAPPRSATPAPPPTTPFPRDELADTRLRDQLAPVDEDVPAQQDELG